jgi:hypothetical protein
MYSQHFKGSKKGFTKEQIEALGYYRYCNIQEDRYAESVFYVPGSTSEKRLAANTAEAVKQCEKLGVGQYC